MARYVRRAAAGSAPISRLAVSGASGHGTRFPPYWAGGTGMAVIPETAPAPASGTPRQRAGPGAGHAAGRHQPRLRAGIRAAGVTAGPGPASAVDRVALHQATPATAPPPGPGRGLLLRTRHRPAPADAAAAWSQPEDLGFATLPAGVPCRVRGFLPGLSRLRPARSPGSEEDGCHLHGRQITDTFGSLAITRAAVTENTKIPRASPNVRHTIGSSRNRFSRQAADHSRSLAAPAWAST